MNSIKIVDRGYDDVLIVFSALLTKKGKFDLYKQAMALPVNIIYVNDYENNWYLTGTPEFESSLTFINFLLGKIYRLKSIYGHLYTIGGSMGAYAALKYGSLLQADKILAFVPESELFLPYGRSTYIRNKIHKVGEGDISKLHYKNPEEVCIISVSLDIVDLYSAAQIKKNNEKIKVQIIPNEEHKILLVLHEKKVLNQIIKSYFFEENIDKVLKFDKNINLIQATKLKRFNEDLQSGKINCSFKNDILDIKQKFPNWSILYYYIGRILVKENKLDNAIKYFAKSIFLKRSFKEAKYHLIKTYIKKTFTNKSNFNISQLQTTIKKVTILLKEKEKDFTFNQYEEIDFNLVETLLKKENWTALFIISNQLDLRKIGNRNLSQYHYIMGKMFLHFIQKEKALFSFAKSLSYNKKPNNSLMQYAGAIYSIHNHKLITKQAIQKVFIENKFNIQTVTFDLIQTWFKSQYWKACVVCCYLINMDTLKDEQLSEYYYILAVSNRNLDYYNEAIFYYTKSLACAKKANNALMGYATLIHEMNPITLVDKKTVLADFSGIDYSFENITFDIIKRWYKLEYWRGVHIACLLFDVSTLTKDDLSIYYKIFEKTIKNIKFQN